MNEECGVFGIFCRGIEVCKLAYFGLFALQHRGQESAGITVSDGIGMSSYKDVGLVNQVFRSDYKFSNLRGHIGIGHVRYSTTGSSDVKNAQPLVATRENDSDLMEIDLPSKGPYYNPNAVLALSHNGNLINTNKLREKLKNEGYKFQTTSDTEVIIYLIEYYTKQVGKFEDNIEEAIKKCMHELKGAYSLVIMTPDRLFGVRDPKGIRPLCLGKMPGAEAGYHHNGDGGYVFASESCALDIVGAELVREVEPGECCIIQPPAEPRSIFFEDNKSNKKALCIFELIYFARPDSEYNGILVEEVREGLGKQLAEECSIYNVDFVMPVPESGIPAANGYSEMLGIKFTRGLIKNRYVMRTFILPDQHLRELGIKLKLNPLKSRLKGKSVILVDDSIVRGTTSAKIVKMLRDVGVKEVHMLVSCPPIKYPCFYGIDTANRSDLLASNKDEEEMRKYIGADSLKFLSLEGLLKAARPALNHNGNISKCYGYCTACFDGNYPIPIPKNVRITKDDFES